MAIITMDMSSYERDRADEVVAAVDVSPEMVAGCSLMLQQVCWTEFRSSLPASLVDADAEGFLRRMDSVWK